MSGAKDVVALFDGPAAQPVGVDPQPHGGKEEPPPD